MAAQTVIKLRRDTAANWTSTNPTLASGEQGFETDTGKVKIGNGSTAWTSLAYSNPGGTVPQSQVTNLTSDLAAKAPLVSPSLTTPSLGVATATSINGTTIPSTSTLVTTASGTATAATTATNIAGGAASQIPYQTGSGATSFIANGTSGQVLTSNGSSAPAWATPAGGGGKTLISSTSSSAGTQFITLSSIPQTYKSLEVHIRHTNYTTAPQSYTVYFNGVTTSTYHSGMMSYQAANGATTTTAPTYAYRHNQVSAGVGSVVQDGAVVFTIDNYASTVATKIGSSKSAMTFMSPVIGVTFGTLAWVNTSAITSMTIGADAVSGKIMVIDLYGIS